MSSGPHGHHVCGIDFLTESEQVEEGEPGFWCTIRGSEHELRAVVQKRL